MKEKKGYDKWLEKCFILLKILQSKSQDKGREYTCNQLIINKMTMLKEKTKATFNLIKLAGGFNKTNDIMVIE